MKKNNHTRGNKNKPNQSSISSFGLNRSWRQIAGTHAILEALRVRPKTIKMAILKRQYSSSAELKLIADELKRHQIQIEERSDQEISKMAPSHQGAILFSDFHPTFNYMDIDSEEQSLIIALDGVEDPHNLGAVLRTGWLMGAAGLFIPEDRAVGLTPTVHKVACGGVEHVPIAKMNNFTDSFDQLKQAGFWIFGLSHKAKKSIYDLKIPKKVIWVLGAEDKGLRIPTERACDELISIPQAHSEASYNVSVAAAIVLSETKRQWVDNKK